MTDKPAYIKAVERLADLKSHAPQLRRSIAWFKQARIKHEAVDAPFEADKLDAFIKQLEGQRQTVQLLIYNLEAVKANK